MDEEKKTAEDEATMLQKAVEAGRTDGDGPDDVEVAGDGE